MPGLNDLTKEDLAVISKTLMECVSSATAVTDYLDNKGVDTKELKESIGGVVEVLQVILGAYQKSIKEDKKN